MSKHTGIGPRYGVTVDEFGRTYHYLSADFALGTLCDSHRATVAAFIRSGSMFCPTCEAVAAEIVDDQHEAIRQAVSA